MSALHDEVAAAGIAPGECGDVVEEVEWDVLVMVHHGLFSDPVECGHDVFVSWVELAGGIIDKWEDGYAHFAQVSRRLGNRRYGGVTIANRRYGGVRVDEAGVCPLRRWTASMMVFRSMRSWTWSETVGTSKLVPSALPAQGRLTVGNIASDDYTAVIQALTNDNDTQVIARPYITVRDGQEAVFSSARDEAQLVPPISGDTRSRNYKPRAK